MLDELNDKDVLLEDDEVEMRHEDEMPEKLEDDDCDLDEEKQLEEELEKEVDVLLEQTELDFLILEELQSKKKEEDEPEARGEQSPTA